MDDYQADDSFDDELVPNMAYLHDGRTNALLDCAQEMFFIADDEAASRLLTATVNQLLSLGFDAETIGDLAEEFAAERERLDAEAGEPSLRTLAEERIA